MKKKIISILLSLVICLMPLTAFAAPADIPYKERPTTVDTDGINLAIEMFAEDLKKPSNKKKVFEDYHTLIHLAARNGDTYNMNGLELEKINYGFNSSQSRDDITKNRYDAVMYGEDIKSAIKSALDSRYAEDFKEYWGEERTKRVESFKGRPDITEDNLKNTFYDRYYELLNNNAESLEFAKLLREIIEHNTSAIKDSGYDNYIDYLYASCNTGFTAEEVIDYALNVCEAYNYYVNKFSNYGEYLGLSDVKDDKEINNPIEAMSYVKKIDPRFEEAYEYLVKNGLLFCKNDGFLRGATFPMYSYGDASILVSGSGAMDVLIHEFGHYQSFMNTEVSDEDLFFGYSYKSDTQELNSQTFELISTDYYDDIYGEAAKYRKFSKITSLMHGLSYQAYIAMTEIALYMPEFTAEYTDEALNEILTDSFGEKWYQNCQYFFTNPGVYINYSLALFDALQIYNMYLNDKNAGVDKYLEACAYGKSTYKEITEKLGLVSAFDENAGEQLNKITEDIFKSQYNIDYETALDYFENGVYIGKVFPTKQRVSVNGGEAQTLYAYNSNGYNYIRIRDLAKLLNGTDAQFDVEYDEKSFTVNIITGKPYTPDGTAMEKIPVIETAGQKASGTSALLRNGEAVNSGGAMFINNWNFYMLRGLAENNVLDIEVGYDKENDVVTITTK